MPLTFLNAYQSVPLKDGSVSHGLFDSVKWFESIKGRVDFSNKSVLDLGACMFSYGVQAINCGAASVLGLDTDPQRVSQSKEVIAHWGFDNAEMVEADAETYNPTHFDVVIFSMIIHWMKNPEDTIKKYVAKSNELVFIYRYPQDGVSESGFRPTIEQLDAIVGRPHSSATKISSTAEQNIMMAIYSKAES